jgi:orotate phosphoribosyltransferase
MDHTAQYKTKLNELKSLILKLSYKEGDFTLASGQKSGFYIDLKTTTLHPAGAVLVGELAVMKLQMEGIAVEGVGGLTLGADPIATGVSVAAYGKGMIWPAFIVRKEPKAHGTSKYIEGEENLRKNSPLLVVEDVVTTGASAIKAVERLREQGYHPVAVFGIVDREQGGGAAVEKAGLRLFSLLTISDLRKK